MLTAFLLRLATFFGAGLLPKGPGTWGSLAALPLAALLMLWGPFPYMIFCALFLPIAVISAEAYEKMKGEHDLSEIVVDEVIGMLVSLVWLPMTWRTFALGFVLFRIFDILKPFPISYLDRKVGGGVGVVADDLLAGIIVNVILQAVYQNTDWLGLQWSGGFA